MVTNIRVFEHKIGYNSACIEDKVSDSCAELGVFWVGQFLSLYHISVVTDFAYCHLSVTKCWRLSYKEERPPGWALSRIVVGPIGSPCAFRSTVNSSLLSSTGREISNSLPRVSG